jgi:orotate phosphoribosyltransferase
VAALAGEGGRVVLVVRQASTSGEGVARAVALLREAGAELDGVVMIVKDERAMEAVWR